VAELKKLLSALIKGKQSFERVHAAFQQFLNQSPDKAPLVAKLLRAARDSGLPHPMYVALSGDLRLPLDMDRDPEATVLVFDDGNEHSDEFDRRASAPNTVINEEGGLVPLEGRHPHRRIDAGTDGVKTTKDRSGASRRGTVDSRALREAPGEATQMDAVLDDPLTNNSDRGPAEVPDGGGNIQAFTPSVKLNPAKENATRGNTDATDKTIAVAEADFDLFSHEALASAEKTADPNTGASWPTIREQRHAGVSRAFRKGDQLRNRFELISQLGEGGMGAVWKGKDLLKEEARDRNPFVAIKLLQGDFKEYPEAFIALQRETAKQQRLAHPNIATVYDFDRDDSSNTVYMTMEVLEGQPLDAFIRKLPAGGLAVEEAMPLIAIVFTPKTAPSSCWISASRAHRKPRLMPRGKRRFSTLVSSARSPPLTRRWICSRASIPILATTSTPSRSWPISC
jgi:hypothetical protein